MASNDLPPPPSPDILFRINPTPAIPVLPSVKENEHIDIRYPLIDPYAYAHIYWDQQANELVYFVEEPQLTNPEIDLLITVERGIEELINISFLNIKTTDAVVSYLEKNIKVLLAEIGAKVSEGTFLKLMYYVYRDFVGLNEIEPLMKDYFIEDIECNGVDAPLYIVHRKYRNLRTNINFHNTDQLASFVEKLAQKCGKYISYANPILDGRLPDKSRANATYSQEISSRGPTFSIRKFTTEPWSPVKMIQFKTLSPEMLAYLWLMIEHETNFIVIGGTGSGKTSLLNALAFFIPPAARVISIEDTRELNLVHENWLPSVAREAIGVGDEGRFGEVDLFTLLKESFRQRPDYVIVGEIRGQEAFVLFQGAASGHPSACTMHAEDVDTMVKRLETPPINLSPSLVEIMDIVCIIAQAKVNGEDVRRVKSIVEIIRIDNKGNPQTNTPFVWDPASDTFFFKTESVMFQKLISEYGLTMNYILREFSMRTKLLMEMYRRNIVEWNAVQEVINAYYKSPEMVLKRFGIK